MEQIFGIITTRKDRYKGDTMTFKQNCLQANINYNRAYNYKYKHPELTEEQVINYYLTSVSFAEKCRQAGIEYRRAIEYKRRHPELNEEQAIEEYSKSKDKPSIRSLRILNYLNS